MKEQIEQLTEDLCDIECKGMKCNECDHYACEYRMLSEALYNAGYRKQKEGEWLVVYEYNDYRMCKEAKIACSVCGHKPKYEGYLSDMNFCPNCGAHMRGGKNE